MPVPYIGITDFTNAEQVRRMLAVFSAHLPKDSQRRLHVGVMMSYKTLHDLETSWAKVFPPKEAISDIFASDDVMNCLHYADYDARPKLWHSISEAIGYGGIGIHAIQLDMPWPDPGDVANGVHTSRKNIEVILQIGGLAFKEAHEDPSEVVRRLEDYEGVIHHVLLDKSMGRGRPMDPAWLLPFARAIRTRFPDLGIGVAGGLGPETVHLAKPIVEEFPDISISIDAQARLRPSGDAHDPIDWGMAETYLVNALGLFQ